MKTTGKIATAFLLMVYVSAFVGFRLHECSVDHTVEILSVLACDTCEEVHHHHCSGETHCGHHHHHCEEEHDATGTEGDGVQIGMADCCANSLYCLTDAQITPEGGDEEMVECLLGIPSPIYSFSGQSVGCVTASASYPALSGPSGCAVLVLYSVRRV